MEVLGKFLIKKCIITEHELIEATQLADQYNSSLAEILLAEGYANPHTLYSAIAEYENLEFADLYKTPCDKVMLDSSKRDIYNNLKAIPWKKDENIIIIAACKITDSLKQWAHENYSQYRFAITSPFDIHKSLNELFVEQNTDDARDRLWRALPQYSAKDLFKNLQSRVFLLFTMLLILLFISFPRNTLLITFVIISLFYGATIFFKTMLFFIGMLRGKHIEQTQKYLQSPDKELPIYTILVPLYQETRVLKNLTDSIMKLDYPKSKLDVKLIVEADDELTINAIKKLKCPRMFEMIAVPYSMPRTKPKACNYALRFARGEFVTIYDAEDVPEPLQLKKVLHTFYSSPDDVKCVQSKLNFFNYGENCLSRLFAIEYSTLFDFLLFGLEAMNVPIPLGGTSNHFRKTTLDELYAWDPYNVTEDADLGIRIAQKGWRCKVIDSLTLEECPIDIGSWIRQRSRWVKGHMQTYFVHMRSPLELYKKVGLVGFMGIQFFLGAPAFIFLISPIMWLVCLCFLAGILNVPEAMPVWFDDLVDISITMLAVGAALHILQAAATARKNKWPGMWPYCLIFPFYWVLHSIASFRAMWQLITRPYYWEKTNHGVTKLSAAI